MIKMEKKRINENLINFNYTENYNYINMTTNCQ